jgi:hypothetical protein
MSRSNSILKLAFISALLVAATMSGCRTITGSISKSLASSPEAAKYDSTCEKRCADLVGKDYDDCHMLCMLSERELAKEMAKERFEKEKSEFEKKSQELSGEDQAR